MAELLELPQLVDEHRVAEMEVGRGRIETGLDAQGDTGLEPLFQLGQNEHFFGATAQQLQVFEHQQRLFFDGPKGLRKFRLQATVILLSLPR